MEPELTATRVKYFSYGVVLTPVVFVLVGFVGPFRYDVALLIGLGLSAVVWSAALLRYTPSAVEYKYPELTGTTINSAETARREGLKGLALGLLILFGAYYFWETGIVFEMSYT